MKFSSNLDDLWNAEDADQNGFLCVNESKKFLTEVQKIIQQDKAKNFEIEKFPAMFEKFDDDNNGYLTKSEMS